MEGGEREEKGGRGEGGEGEEKGQWLVSGSRPSASNGIVACTVHYPF